VIVAVYNAAPTLRDCLDSLLQLDYPRDRLELLCVDNASTDDTPRVLHDYRERFGIVREEKRGPAAARNAGLRRAAGEVIALTDADCVVDPNWLRCLVQPLADAGVGVVGGTILSKRPCNSIEAFGEQIHDHCRALNEFRPPYAITMNWGARMDVIRAVGHFNEDLVRCSDVDWSYRMTCAGYRGVYAPAAVVYHRNERTPWGLLHEGYVHGYHAVRVTRLHADLVRHAREERAHHPAAVATDGVVQHRCLPPQPWRDALWSRLFRAGKRLGRAHGSLSAG
jgi:glycosyltransferase involved in cell wall biosynthesis